MTESKRQTLRVLLPEQPAEERIPAQPGACSAGTLKGIGESMEASARSRYGSDVFSARSRLLAQLSGGEQALWRGLLAVALLHDTWQEDSEVTVEVYDGTSSAFAQAALNAAGGAALRLVVLRRGKLSGVLGIADEAFGLIPPATGEKLAPMLPSRVTWYDRKKGEWLDPCACLNQRDRLTLAARLEAMPGDAALQDFARDIRAQEDAVRQHALDEELGAGWRAALKAVVGLMPESEFGQLTAIQLPCRVSLEGNPLLSSLGVELNERLHQPPQLQYCWQGHPFARSHVELGVEPVAGAALDALMAESELVEQTSRRYARDLSERLGEYLETHGAELLPGAMEEVRRWQTEAKDRSLEPVKPLEMTWPWDRQSPALLLLLREALGDAMAEAMLSPFTGTLTLMAEAALGDAAMGMLCRLRMDDGDWTALPPLSEGLAAVVAQGGWTDGSRLTDCLQLESRGQAVVVTLQLRGAGEVRLKRRFRPDELRRWTAERVPDIALWPSVPLPPERWHAYWLTVRGGVEVRCLCGGKWVGCTAGADAYRVLTTDTMPSCVTLHEDGLCVGAVCCQAPLHHPAHCGDAAAALDFGATGTAMALSVAGQNQLVQVPPLLQVMLQRSTMDPGALPLPAWGMGPVVPSAVTLWSDAAQPALFEGGAICPEEVMGQREALADLIWRTDPTAQAARQLLFQQSMLLTALHAVMCGADRIGWNVALPTAMSRDARGRLQQELQRAADWTSRTTGLMTAAGSAVYPQRESVCAGLYLRDSGLMQGPFAMLTIGATDASMALWLRGMNRPATEFHVSGGITSMLLPALSAHPSLLARELEGVCGFSREMLMLPEEESLPAWSRRHLVLDRLLGSGLQEAQQRMDAVLCAGGMTRIQALLLLGFASLMTLTGHALEQVRRNPLLNDYLPVELQICLCGRGSLVLTGMNPGLTNAMAGFVRLSMSLDHPVRALRLTMSGCPKLEAVLGVAEMHPASAMEAAEHPMPDVMPLLHLMARFLMQFRAAYPQACALLFPGMFDQLGSYTPEAQNAITEAVMRQGGGGAMEHRFLQCLEEVRLRYDAPDEALEKPVTQAGAEQEKA